MNSQLELFSKCLSELQAQRPVVRAVILRTWGSTPREVGADMVLGSDGGLWGTVGGGCGEAEVYELAQELLSQERASSATILHIDLTENPDDGGGKVCGGRFDVLLHRLNPTEHLDFVRAAVEAMENESGLCWRTEWSDVEPGFWKMGDVSREMEATLKLETGQDPEFVLSCEGVKISFSEPVGLSRTLVIVGAGHIARPLCAMAGLAGYKVVVLDDRREYADQEFFPTAAQVVCGEYNAILPELAKGPLKSVVLVTRGHRHDQECLRLVAHLPLEYIGMIGSQRRIDAVYRELVEEGVDIDDLTKVCAPIGLEIGAQTPAEIACCILAQMIQRRRLPEAGRKAPNRVRHTRSLA